MPSDDLILLVYKMAKPEKNVPALLDGKFFTIISGKMTILT